MTNKKVTIEETESVADALEYDDLGSFSVSQNQSGDVQVGLNQEEQVNIEDISDEELLWENGPTAGEVKKWKEQYSDVFITSVSYDNHIVWRVLNRTEYKAIVRRMEELIQSGTLTSAEANMWNEEAITEVCMLFPTYSEIEGVGIMAGVPSLIAQEVLEASGFVALEVRQL